MTHAEAWRRFQAQSRVCDDIWRQIRECNDRGVWILDPERRVLHERACTASQMLIFLYDFLPETKAENALLGPPEPITEAELAAFLDAVSAEPPDGEAPPTQTPPRFPPSRLFGRLPPCTPSRQ